MKTSQLLCVVLAALLVPAWAGAGAADGGAVQDLADKTPVDTADGIIQVDAAGATSSAERTAVATPSSNAAVRSAIAAAFRASDASVPCADGRGVGCSIAATALGTALFDEREEYRANETFLNDR